MSYVPPHLRHGSKLKLPSAVMPPEEEVSVHIPEPCKATSLGSSRRVSCWVELFLLLPVVSVIVGTQLFVVAMQMCIERTVCMCVEVPLSFVKWCLCGVLSWAQECHRHCEVFVWPSVGADAPFFLRVPLRTYVFFWRLPFVVVARGVLECVMSVTKRLLWHCHQAAIAWRSLPGFERSAAPFFSWL